MVKISLFAERRFLLFDYAAITTYNRETAEGLLNDTRLCFSTKVLTRTGKPLDGIHEAEFANMMFTVYSNGRIDIKGSLHKLYNFLTIGKPFNHDTFTLSKVKYTIGYLQQEFEIDPSNCQIHGFEFGFNVKPKDFKTTFKNFVAFKQWRFNRMESERPIEGWECATSTYKIKIYNKSLDLGLPDNILRFEKKSIKMRALETYFPLGLKLIDLLNPHTWEKCKESLLQSLEDCIISDQINTSKLSANDRKVFNKGNNPREWEEINNRSRYHLKNRYNAVVEKFGTQKTKAELIKLINAEFKKMLNPKNSSIRLFHHDSEKATLDKFTFSTWGINPISSLENHSFTHQSFLN